ncbi:3,4-dihydroxy 2-butanone 4-phosphate synthase/GTP cyclohydrolase II [Xanthobacter flavus]|uniref:3,4-dihydroxy-2-butanone 4-phosphate synthase n=1 Tax=Xanthobacter flavus TaxID=281 RepID=A0A9W6CH44_XANFL|nr:MULTISPECIES: 3,4-dihydroxy-2-butanone-4-phosphate synthase [Xanthobacter]MDR6331904.1 3,4-dihydroxy 2-butanone 4-phosphate synthase/GTP cyclohydrolase II [Xanthobacter flavus]NMN56249.1 3,4-dihydroxy 2-butanone 4-phosphate synthase/GTP cyclohydrolase II [Xanthobacter sp. SG618]GLI22303.1 3,4-dihydroxy-2-butanone 4-phosphate synthase [Xanthobacter flavus]
MKLAEWLSTTGTKRSAFARQVGMSPASVTALCNDERAWISRETAEKIAEATGQQVTPNDFLGLSTPLTRGLPVTDTTQARVQSAIEAIARGEIIVVTDDDDRENEGDLILAASLATPEKMAFVIRNTSGIVCTPLPPSEAKRLRLDPMVSNNDAPMGTAFTVSIDVRHGTTTGISAEERTNTVRALANPNMGAGDFVRPGHVFPLIAREGGVLIRSGHTEAAVDLCRLAGLPPIGVIAELVNDDGTVQRGPQVTAFAEKHNLTRISVAEIIAYRQAREKLVTRAAEFPVPTVVGELQGYSYVTPFDPVNHLALVKGRIGDGEKVLVRLHRADAIADAFSGGKVLQKSLERIEAEGRGVLVYLRDGTSGVPAVAMGQNSEKSTSELERDRHWREVGLGAQILRDLGIQSIRLLSSKTRTYVGLAGFGIEILGTETLD